MRRGNFHVMSLQSNGYIVAISCGWFTHSSVWADPCACICHSYDLTRFYLFHYSDVICVISRLISLATWLFVHKLLLFDNKAPQSSTYCPFLRVSANAWWIHSQRAGDADFSMSFRHYESTERHASHIIVSWPNPKQLQMVHTSDLIMMIDEVHVFSQPLRDR